MPGIIPFYIIGTVTKMVPGTSVVYVKVVNGNVYHLYPNTPGIIFSELQEGQQVELEITNELVRVFSARILNENED